MNRLKMSGLFLAVALGASACSGVDRRMKPAYGQVSIIRCGQIPKIGRLSIERVDGVDQRPRDCHGEIPSGRRNVEVSFIYGDGVSAWTSDGNCSLRFNAEPNAIYTLNADVDFPNRSWTAWIADLMTGQRLDQCQTITRREIKKKK